jgi:2-keto-4-pentenoate hydratase/2-oxohepta-3-ene-1,7-dioic acid hydratase in catechol pathway
MRIVNAAGRAAVAMPDGGLVDVAAASAGRFGPDPRSLFDEWDAFAAWTLDLPAVPTTRAPLGPPVPAPRQVFAIGMNYRGHAAEVGAGLPESPPTFTKFPSCLTGPDARVTLPSDRVDWEVELVVVIGRRAERVREDAAWDHVAGLTVGQDLSERAVQLAGQVPQFSLGKSFAGFGPIGPAVVTVDELADPDSLELGCAVNGETVQEGRTDDMVFGVPELVARLSAVCTLLPGDLIFTGTPAGVGAARTPPRFLRPGDTLRSWVGGVGELRTAFVADR